MGNMKDGPFRGRRSSYNSFVGRECVPTNTSREVCHSNCGETTLKNTRSSNEAKWNLALEKLLEFRFCFFTFECSKFFNPILKAVSSYFLRGRLKRLILETCITRMKR